MVVTHEVGFAREVADQVVFMVDGRIVEQGSSDEVLNHPQHPRTRQFLSGNAVMNRAIVTPPCLAPRHGRSGGADLPRHEQPLPVTRDPGDRENSTGLSLRGTGDADGGDPPLNSPARWLFSPTTRTRIGSDPDSPACWPGALA